MNDSGRRSDLFRRMRRQRSSPMHYGIAVVALPRLDEKSPSRAYRIGHKGDLLDAERYRLGLLKALRPGVHG
jgi:hypothetical protein